MREFKVVMTVMVRDEADVIAAMLEHHLAQGIDLILVTDNGSVDGTRQILAEYEQSGRVIVSDYLAHDKNQTAVVSAMASRAATEFNATWVINADADEFFIPTNPETTLKEALQHTPTGVGSFSVPVVNMTGEPAARGGWVNRLVLRDKREEGSLMETVALHAHPSDDVIHIGRPGVTVQQGNHGVDIPSLGRPSAEYDMEVHHFPWRTYEQYSTKVMNTGLSYDANPLLNPSPRHHGMRDYRLLRAGLLEDVYLHRHPFSGDEKGFSPDDRVARGLHRLLEGGAAVHPSLLESALSDEWGSYDDVRRRRAKEVSELVIPLVVEEVGASTRWRDLYRGEAARRLRAERDADELRRELRGSLPTRLDARRTRVRRFAALPGRVARYAARRLRRALGR
ncbi:glycosyltransferase involved in cell wall biosynthesis [Microbacterium sp. SORGH_AS 505]|uniref:glycosyltransferase family 2 protein n=1 Tax=Microbacterium sp. SORGH_AS_0505 TaxID=3041770 RepID=UPI00277E2B36|nr:glycosyltransferase family 2 protein [Microbacterium sp. SORGH_AS_0505]MDQ1125245.1 glycosyltransferase involved in cell wall biosynthesis [Microbacterium sp. SORGH_AS_0505]